MNYAQLVTALEDLTENYDTVFISNIPLFFKAAEKKIYNSIKIPDVGANTAAALTSGVATITTPAGFLAVFELAVINASNEYAYLLNKEVGYIRESYPVIATTGTPKYYAIQDEVTILLGPTPGAGFTYNLRYYAYPTTIVTASTTWLGDNFDSLLLYGAAVEAAVFMKQNKEDIDKYEAQFVGELELLKRYCGGLLPNDAFRGGQLARTQ